MTSLPVKRGQERNPRKKKKSILACQSKTATLPRENGSAAEQATLLKSPASELFLRNRKTSKDSCDDQEITGHSVPVIVTSSGEKDLTHFENQAPGVTPSTDPEPSRGAARPPRLC